MPKKVEYPNASFAKAVELADSTKRVGGSAGKAHFTLVGKELGRKESDRLSGAFSYQIQAAVKHGLVEFRNEEISITPLYREIYLAYTEDDKQHHLQEAFLRNSLFEKLYRDYLGSELPESILPKKLVKELSVPDEIGSRVAGYFIDGLRQVGLLGGHSGKLVLSTKDQAAISDDSVGIESNVEVIREPATEPSSQILDIQAQPIVDGFQLTLIAPGNAMIRESFTSLEEFDDVVAYIRKKVERFAKTRTY